MPNPLTADDPYLYVLERSCGLIKVGFAHYPTERAKQIAAQERAACTLVWWCRVPRKKADMAKRCAQWQLREWHVRSEWFNATIDAAIDAIEEAATGLDQTNGWFPCPWHYEVTYGVSTGGSKLSDA